jgi:ubiquinone/menaquinone biosynthesis C-methylase UbiE
MISVDTLNFSEIVGIVNEPNRCSGGANTIRRIIQETQLPAGSTILEVGSNTGYSIIEMALLRPDCNFVGIDMNSNSVKLSKEKAQKYEITNVKFICADITELKNGELFDLVFVSNVTSFISAKEKALFSYNELLKPKGILAAVPIYYFTTPPKEIKEQVEIAIGATLNENSIEYWLELFESKIFEARHIFREDYRYEFLSLATISEYVDYVFEINDIALAKYDKETILSLKSRLNYFFNLFNDNLQYCGFSILLFRKSKANSEKELHKSFRMNTTIVENNLVT